MNVMIITQDLERRTRLVDFLGAKGYDVLVPPRRQDTVPMVKQARPHAIVLDLYVADPNGADLLCELRADGYAGKVVALSGLGTQAVLSKCWREGVDHVVGGIHMTSEPVDPGQVEAAIRASFRGEITQRAYLLWLRHGRPEGQDRQHWVQAEREIFGEQRSRGSTQNGGELRTEK